MGLLILGDMSTLGGLIILGDLSTLGGLLILGNLSTLGGLLILGDLSTLGGSVDTEGLSSRTTVSTGESINTGKSDKAEGILPHCGVSQHGQICQH